MEILHFLRFQRTISILSMHYSYLAEDLRNLEYLTYCVLYPRPYNIFGGLILKRHSAIDEKHLLGGVGQVTQQLAHIRPVCRVELQNLLLVLAEYIQ